ncbi:MAG: MBL fold metallo-hydrolase [Bacteroidota bacterium]
MKISFPLFKKSAILILLVIASCDSQEGNLTQSVTVLKGDVNGVVIQKNNKTVVIYGDPQDSAIKPENLLLTHCRRDLLWAAESMTENGTKTYVPAAELDLFTKTDSFWNNFTHARFEDYDQQSSKYPAKPMDVTGTLQGGDIFKWQDLEFHVINTPGYTRGAISYICQIDGKKIAFTGDLIYGDGQLFDLYSLQDKIPELEIWGYHGFASRMADLIKSLQVLKSQKPDIIVPARGPVIHDPESAMDKLTDRLQRLYGNYLSTTAFRWYTGIEKQIALAERVQLDSAAVDWIPMATTSDDYPSWLQHVNNTVLIKSESGSSFLIDCGEQDTYRRFRDHKGDLSQLDIDGIFITHYHNDHTAFIPALIEKHQCPVYVTEELEDILRSPEAYRMPAMTGKPIHNIRVVPDRHTMQWNEFSFTFYNYPGQTIYHNALLVETKKDKVFFIGDSFSPSGVDDYCIQNRNIMEEGQGYYYCMDLLRTMPGDIWLVNQHIHKLFRFSPEQLDVMETKLKEREMILAELSPWEDINYIIDERWARFYPYGSVVKQGEEHEFSIIVKNHQHEACTYRVKPNVGSTGLSVSPIYQEITLPAKKEGRVTFSLSAPLPSDTGLHVITADLIYNDKHLHEWCEGIIQLK